jgi:ABC-type multidrug transport system permease subunit
MRLTLIINTIVCVVGAAVGVLFAGGSIISIANMPPSRAWLIWAAILVPVAFVVSGIGAWLAYAWSTTPVIIGLMALPWVYGIIFIVLMLMSFKS